MRVLLLAPPGAGKGTQGARLAEHFGIAHIATGDLLRDELRRGTELGERVRSVLDRGELVSDELMLDLVFAAVRADSASAGYVLDGFPRTANQAHEGRRLAKQHGLQAQVALHLQVTDDEVTRRLLARRDGRSDDTEPVIRRRLALYHEVSAPVLDYYRYKGLLVDIDAMQSVDAVAADAIGAVQAATT